MNGYSLVYLSALGCLTIFFLYNMFEFIKNKARDKFFLPFKIISAAERALHHLNLYSLELYYGLVHVCVYDLHVCFMPVCV